MIHATIPILTIRVIRSMRTCPSTTMTNRSSKVSSRRTHIQTALEPARNQARFQRARSVSPIVSMLAIADARLVEPLVQSQEQPVVSH